MTTLISARDIRNMAREGKTRLELVPGMVVTPLARDGARKAGIQLVQGSGGMALGKENPLQQKESLYREDAPAQNPGQGPALGDEPVGQEMVAAFSALLRGFHERGILTQTGVGDRSSASQATFHLALADGGVGTIEAGIDPVQPGMAWRNLEKDALVYLLEGEMEVGLPGRPLTFGKGVLGFLPAGEGGPGTARGRGRYFYFQYPA